MRKTLNEDDVLKEIDRWIGYLDEDMITRIKIGIKKLPSAQPKKRTETHACDLIDRQAAITLAKDIIVPIKDGTVYKYRCIDPDSIKELPSECNVIYCRDCRFYIGHRCQATRGLDDWRNQDDYCSRAERIDQ